MVFNSNFKKFIKRYTRAFITPPTWKELRSRVSTRLPTAYASYFSLVPFSMHRAREQVARQLHLTLGKPHIDFVHEKRHMDVGGGGGVGACDVPR